MCTKIFLIKPQTKWDRTKPFICCPRSTIYLPKQFIQHRSCNQLFFRLNTNAFQNVSNHTFFTRHIKGLRTFRKFWYVCTILKIRCLSQTFEESKIREIFRE